MSMSRLRGQSAGRDRNCLARVKCFWRIPGERLLPLRLIPCFVSNSMEDIRGVSVVCLLKLCRMDEQDISNPPLLLGAKSGV